MKLPGYSKFFAYPNGNWSAQVEEELHQLGYAVVVDFDHRLDGIDEPLRVSRLRISADVPLPPFTAIGSGCIPRPSSWSREPLAGVRSKSTAMARHRHASETDASRGRRVASGANDEHHSAG